MASHDTKKTVNNVYTLHLLTKEVGELTQHIGETTYDVREQDEGKTTLAARGFCLQIALLSQGNPANH